MFKTNESDFGYNSNSGGKHCLLTSNVIEKIKKSNSGKKRSEETKKKNKSSIIW